MPIRILVVDDHELIRSNIRRLLATSPEFEIVAEAYTGLGAIHEAQKHQPEIVLLDIGLPDTNGLVALPLILHVAPAAKVVMVSNHDDATFVQHALSGGAHGFLSKADVAPQLVSAMQQVLANKRFLSRSLTKAKAQESPAGVAAPKSAEA